MVVGPTVTDQCGHIPVIHVHAHVHVQSKRKCHVSRSYHFFSCFSPLQCLWLRVRISLLRCLREAQLIAEQKGASPSAHIPIVDDGRGKGEESESGTAPSSSSNPVDHVSVFSERLEEFFKSMELLSQHVGTRMLRQQRSRTLVSGWFEMKRVV